MSGSAIRALYALALLALLGPAAVGSDMWLTEFEPVLPSELMFLDGKSTTPTTPLTVAYDIRLPEGASARENKTDTETLPPIAAPNQTTGDENPASDEVSCCGAIPDERNAKPTYYVDGEVIALRAHFGEIAVGKLAEKYEASERLILGVENAAGAGGRIRYWSYDRTTPLLRGSGDSIRFDFDVIDFEGTTRFTTDRFDLVIAGGLRWADIKIDTDRGRSRNDMPGGTIAAELRGMVCLDCENGLEWHSVTGARMSIFGGDWEGGPNGLITPTRDDNITVLEIYGGIECACDCRGHVLYARLLFESQNWRSDSLGRDTGQDSLSFIGPGISLGMIY